MQACIKCRLNYKYPILINSPLDLSNVKEIKESLNYVKVFYHRNTVMVAKSLLEKFLLFKAALPI